MRSERYYYVYILANWAGNVLYTGVTNDLKRRVLEHKNKEHSGFTATYEVNRLVYYETYDDVEYAIHREKQFKAGSRRKKVLAITRFNPVWIDLFDRL